MYAFDEDMVYDIYYKQLKALEKSKRFDPEYNKRIDHLNACILELRKTLSHEQNLLLERLLGAMQIFNHYNECVRFGNGMKYMNDLHLLLRNKY